MTQEYRSAGSHLRDRDMNDDTKESPPPVGRSLALATVGGSGSESGHAATLRTMLQADSDSGYGGSSVADHDLATLARSAWPSVTQQNPPRSGAVHQLWYNQHRLELGLSIGNAIELLRGLQEKNAAWPARYPSVQRTEMTTPRPQTRPVLPHSFSSVDHDRSGHNLSPVSSTSRFPPPAHLRRAWTSSHAHNDAESSMLTEPEPSSTMDPMSSTIESGTAPTGSFLNEPRLVTPKIAQEFSILRLDLKLGGLHQTELVHSLEKSSIAALLDGKISSSIRHLQSLRERIEDTSSKVLVTGDLNAGKSTFCNALLRRRLLPEDQQPCTAIFCEVLDVRENMGREEVHAVQRDMIYDRRDESTYDVFPLDGLERIVGDSESYHQCKIYIKDARRVDKSLLNNGVVDIALIDAPGLNSDTSKTTAIFARQEEIDVVVFVVSAANHFTLTANEFIMSAAAEKAYFFIVVNGFDGIRDKERCRKMILKQISVLSPHTSKEQSELVHFVSSNAIPTSHPGGDGSGGGGEDPEDNDPKGKRKEDEEKIRDFEQLEESLRRFVLEKRARSKLAPAKTYLLNILNDVHVLATVNSDVARSELTRVTRELEDLEPQLESGKRALTEVGDHIHSTMDKTCQDIYDHARTSLNTSIGTLGDADYRARVPYPGVFGAFHYAEDLKRAMLADLGDAVTRCEHHARLQTTQGVNILKQLGTAHLGDAYNNNLIFRSDIMFSRRRDVQARQVAIPTDLWDFFDLPTLLQNQEKIAGTGVALTVATAVGTRLIGVQTWLDGTLSAVRVLGANNLRRLVFPGLAVAVVAVAAYALSQIPNLLPHRLSAKLSGQLTGLDFVHAQASRISGSAGRVLRIPADELRVALEQSVKELGSRRDQTARVREESAGALRYFSNLVRNSAQQRAVVRDIDLDALPPGGVLD